MSKLHFVPQERKGNFVTGAWLHGKYGKGNQAGKFIRIDERYPTPHIGAKQISKAKRFREKMELRAAS